jgi:hypothetical protein
VFTLSILIYSQETVTTSISLKIYFYSSFFCSVEDDADDMEAEEPKAAKEAGDSSSRVTGPSLVRLT